MAQFILNVDTRREYDKADFCVIYDWTDMIKPKLQINCGDFKIRLSLTEEQSVKLVNAALTLGENIRAYNERV